MAIAPLSAVRSVEAGAAKAPKKTLDQADFLALMTAQLKNQDPTKPVDNTEYVAQMAQFSTLSGVTETNRNLSQVIARLDTLIAQTQLAQSKGAAT